jgi:hypothetical protein
LCARVVVCVVPPAKIGCEARAGCGAQFQTQPQKRGQTAGNWGEKKQTWFKALYDSNPNAALKCTYFNPGQTEIMEANIERKKCLTENRFRYASPMKVSCNVADNFGTFDKLTYKEPYALKERGVKIEIEVPPNIKCNPAKKGSYGNNYNKLIGKEFPYMPESAADARKRVTAERLAHYGASTLNLFGL